MAGRWVTPADRARSGVAAAALVLLAGWLFLNGLRSAHRSPATSQAATLPIIFTILPEPKPVPPPKPPVADRPARKTGAPDPKGAASAPNLRSRATPVQAPPIDPPKPAPVVAAPIASDDGDTTSGASDRVGPGTGAGGSGNGTGSGDGGDGSGGGGGGTPPVQIAGRIRDSDYPRQAGTLGIGGAVEVRYAIDPDGRARDCVILASSGNPTLDAATCTLIERRFRFRPSRGPDGRPRRVYMEQRHEWIVQNLPPEQDGGD